MAHRAEQAECYLISGSGLDKSHCHSYRFNSREAQTNFFIAKAISGGHFTNLYEIRIYDGIIKLKGQANKTYVCDYVMFRNVPVDNLVDGRWFYAFVDKIEYMSDTMFTVYYTIDWIQTYLMDVINNTPSAYCIRQHSRYDVLYTNTKPDNVSTGGVYKQTPVSGWSNIGVEATVDNDGTFVNWAPVIVSGKTDVSNNNLVDGVPNSVEYYWGFNWKWFRDLLEEFNTDAKKEIIDIFMYPVFLLNTNSNNADNKHYVQKVKLAGRGGFNPWESEGFTPNNKKLYTYPFCYVTVKGANQGALEYRNEYWDAVSTSQEFHIYGTKVGTPQFICVPRGYGGIINQDENHADENFIDAVIITGTPKVPWITDQYKAWLAQKESQLAVQQIRMDLQQETNAPMAVMDGIQAVAGLVAGNFMGGAKAGFNAVTGYYGRDLDLLSQKALLQDAKNMPYTVSNYGASNIYYKCGEYGFRAFYTHCSVEYARMADDYFTVFGYPEGKILKPYFFSRKVFCYMKYSGFNVTGVPDSARTEWQNVMLNGITFWNSNARIGDYNVDNGV